MRGGARPTAPDLWSGRTITSCGASYGLVPRSPVGHPPAVFATKSLWTFILLVFCTGGCSAVGYDIRSLAAEINATLGVDAGRIAVGDLIEVRFPFQTEWEHSAVVGHDGKATFLTLGEVVSAGKTTAELSRELTEQYKQGEGQTEGLTIRVIHREGMGDIDSQTMFVIGDVMRPGPVELRGRPLTLFEAIGAAGGPIKPTANLRNTLLIRRVGGELKTWRLDAELYAWEGMPAVFVQSRDILFVPNTAIDDVDIWVDQYIRRLIPLPTLIPG